MLEGKGSGMRLAVARAIDARLLIGASIVGVGWGLGGVCPGPGFTSLGAGVPWAVAYIGALAVGLLLGGAFTRTS